MLKNHLDRCIEECYEEVLHSNDKAIKPIVEELKKEFPEGFFEGGLRCAIADIISILVSDNFDEEMKENDITNYVLSSVLEQVKDMKIAYQFKVELEGYENEVYRIIDVPSVYSLADFAYMILSSFHCDASHLFQFKIKNMRYMCDTFDDFDEYDELINFASDISIKNLDLKKNSKFTFVYDFGEDYSFKITLLQKKEEAYFVGLAYDLIVDGKGFGIWEDASYEMD